MVGGEDLVAGFERQGLGDDVEAARGVDDGSDIGRRCSEFGGDGFAGDAHEIVEAAAEEFDRLAFQFELKRLIGFKDRTWTGAERAVIEKSHVLAEEKLTGEIVGHV